MEHTPLPPTAATSACDLLDADHLAVKHLFVDYARLAYAPDADTAGGARLEIARRICEALTVHAQIEEEIFYPALEQALPTMADVVAEGRAEHQQARELIGRISALPAADAAMDSAVAELARCVEHHVKEERDELFPKARAAGGLDLQDLGTRLRERQQALAAGAG